MGKWGKRLREHIHGSNAPASMYVDYKLFKKAIRACEEDEFRKIYVAEIVKFIYNLERGQELDPDFLDVNMTTIRNTLRKYEKFHEKTYKERLQHGGIGSLHVGDNRNDGVFSVVDDMNRNKRFEHGRKFEDSLVKDLSMLSNLVKIRIMNAEMFARRVFDELSRDVYVEGDGGGEAKGICTEECLSSQSSSSSSSYVEDAATVEGEDGKYLDRAKLTAALLRLGLPSSPSTVEKLIRAVNCDSDDGKIRWRDFKTFMAVREKQVRFAFKRLDSECKGYITSDQIVDGLRLLGVFQPEYLAEKLVAASKERRRRVSSQKWLEMSENCVGVDPAKYGDDDDDDEDEGIDYLTFREMVLLLPAVNEDQKVLEYWQEIVEADSSFTFQRPREGIGSKSSSLITLISGAIAGAVSRTCTAPFDRLKMLMQVDPTYRGLGIVGGLGNIYKVGRMHRIGVDGQFGVASGWRGFTAGTMAYFRGNGTNVVKIMPETAIKFWSYEFARSTLVSWKGGRSEDMAMSDRFLCGASAGITAQTLIYPLEVTKTRMAVSNIGKYSGISHCLFKVARQEGAYALYRGLGASIIGIIPFSGVEMGVYFYLREQVVPNMLRKIRGGDTNDDNNGRPSTLTSPLEISTMLACGCVSSTCGMLVAYPLHLTRTRLQAQGLNGMRKYDGIVSCLRETIRADGFRGLYRGFGANLLKAIPSMSISYAIFETMNGTLRGL